MFGIQDKVLAMIAAALAIIFLLAATAQTVRINGISFFGWYAVSGYKPMWEADERDLVTLRAARVDLVRGLNSCSASISTMKTIGDKVTAAAQKLIDAADANANQLKGNIVAMKAIKSSDEKCPVAESILMRAFQ